MTHQRKQRLRRLLQEARYLLRQRDAAFAQPLTDMLFVATKDVWRMSTNGYCIYFDPDWLQKLKPTELEFMLAHQLMHIALDHINRPKYYSGDRFHLACDIVANSHLETLDLKQESLPHIGKIFRQTFFLIADGRDLTVEEALHAVPFDPAALSPGARRQYMIDSEGWWNKPLDRGEHGVIVLSPDDIDPDDLAIEDEDTDRTPLIIMKREPEPDPPIDTDSEPAEKNEPIQAGSWDTAAADDLSELRTNAPKPEPHQTSDFIERIWQRAHRSTLDWRQLLDSFIQEDVCDYSFTPPDKRLQDSVFFLPDYNVLDNAPKHVLFLVDTSGSVDDRTLSAVYAELCNALTQFNGGLCGVLVFFDTRVYTPIPFSDIDDLLSIKPQGGGGTDYRCAFAYIQKYMMSSPPSSIVIFTDGKADFPSETAAGNVPVLWLFSDSTVSAPWGEYTYIDPIPTLE